MPPSSLNALEFTGERMVPEAASGEIFWEHVYRYRFAAGYVRGRDVLDIACGEGYGSAALRKAGARSLVGVDVSAEAVQHAVAKYGVDARTGSAEAIPLPDGSVDLVVSFETVEHVADPARFLDECARVCRPGGTVIMSTPNKDVYDGTTEAANPYHVSEMTAAEFRAAVGRRFDRVRLFTQRPRQVPWWSPRWLATQQPKPRWLPGAYRVRNLLRGRRPDVTRTLPTGYGDDVIDHVLAADPVGFHVANEFAIRRPTWLADEHPTYLIAVMRRP